MTNTRIAGPDILNLIEKIEIEWNFSESCEFNISDFFDDKKGDIKKRLFERLIRQLISLDIPKKVIIDVTKKCEKKFENSYNKKKQTFMGYIPWIYILKSPLIWYKNSDKKWPYYLLCGVCALYNIDKLSVDKENPSRMILRISNNMMLGDLEDPIYEFLSILDFRDVSRKKLYFSKQSPNEIDYMMKKINDFRSSVFHETRVIIYDKYGKKIENKKE